MHVGAGLVPARYGRESEERAPEDRSKVGVTEVRVNKKFDTDYADCTDSISAARVIYFASLGLRPILALTRDITLC